MKKSVFMMFQSIVLIFIFMGFLNSLYSQTVINYLNLTPPGTTPIIFGQDVIAPGLHTPPVFTHDGKEIYYKNMSKLLITTIKNINGTWSFPSDVSFSASMSSINDPSISGDGKKLFFTSIGILPGTNFPSKENIWFMEKKETGWGEPQALDTIINSINLHWMVNADKKGNLYFSSINLITHEGKIYCSIYSNGKYQKPNPLNESINLKNCMHFSPYVSPEGDYLVFDRSIIVNGQGQSSGLMISFLGQDGAWGAPQYLFSSAQFKQNSRTPQVTPDGKYLFFISWYGTDWQTYWVSTKIIEQKRPAGINKQGSIYPNRDFHLFQNYPNPFNPETTISYEIKSPARIHLEIFDTRGLSVRTLINSEKTSGNYSITWDGKDNTGNTLPSGTYYFSLEGKGFSQIRKALYLK